MTNYHFITHWEIKAPIDQVYKAIYNTLNYPTWWKGVLEVKEISKNNAGGIGDVNAYTWKSILPYKLKFTMQSSIIVENKKLGGNAYGELEGKGLWEFTYENGITFATYYWHVHTTKRWMNFFSPIAKPIFKWNHNIVMRWGAHGLSKLLQAELIKC